LEAWVMAEQTRKPPVIAVIVLLTAVLTVMLIAFAWPAARTEPRDLPLGVAGPAAATGQIAGALNQNAPGAFEIHAYADRAAAVDAIENRDVYGAIVAGPGGPEILTASARGPVVAQVLTQMAGRLAAAENRTPTVTDVVPLPADDPRGAGLAAGALPLVLGGIIAAVALTRLLPSGIRRIRGAVGFAVTGGLALAAVLQFWLGSLEGNYWANSGVIAFSIAATSVAILGLEWLLGTVGLALGAATMMLLGNPLSGMTSAPEMLPTGWGTVGQLLPPGAAGTMLRAVAFFDGANITAPVLVLSAWLLGGLLLCIIGAVRDRSRTVTDQTTLSQPLTPARA
jgi:hypothetical protein